MNNKPKAKLRNIIITFDRLLRSHKQTHLFGSYRSKRVTFSRHHLLPFFRDHPTQTCQVVGDIVQSLKSSVSLLQQDKLESPVVIPDALFKMEGEEIEYFEEYIKKYFIRGIKHQEKAIKERQLSFKVDYLQRPHFQKLGNFQVSVHNLKVSFTLRGKKKQLLQLRDGSILHGNIVTNFLKALKFSKKVEETVQIASLNLLPLAMKAPPGETFTDENAYRIVKSNYGQCANCLESPILSREVTVIPVLLSNHYCMVIIKKLTDRSMQLINCSSRYTDNRKLTTAVCAYIRVQQQTLGYSAKITEKNITSLQLLVPKQVRPNDSGLYLMLNCQTLLTDKNSLQDLDIISSRNKLYLFPRILAQSMRQRIWNFYVRLTDPAQTNKMKVVSDFFDERKVYNERAVLALDYDRIDKNEVKKLLWLTSSNPQPSEEDIYAVELQYFYNKSMGYYEE